MDRCVSVCCLATQRTAILLQPTALGALVIPHYLRYCTMKIGLACGTQWAQVYKRKVCTTSVCSTHSHTRIHTQILVYMAFGFSLCLLNFVRESTRENMLSVCVYVQCNGMEKSGREYPMRSRIPHTRTSIYSHIYTVAEARHHATELNAPSALPHSNSNSII